MTALASARERKPLEQPALVAQAAIQGLVGTALPGLARIDQRRDDAALGDPSGDGPADAVSWSERMKSGAASLVTSRESNSITRLGRTEPAFVASNTSRTPRRSSHGSLAAAGVVPWRCAGAAFSIAGARTAPAGSHGCDHGCLLRRQPRLVAEGAPCDAKQTAGAPLGQARVRKRTRLVAPRPACSPLLGVAYGDRGGARTEGVSVSRFRPRECEDALHRPAQAHRIAYARSRSTCMLTLFLRAASVSDVRSGLRRTAAVCSCANRLFLMTSSLRGALHRNQGREEPGKRWISARWIRERDRAPRVGRGTAGRGEERALTRALRRRRWLQGRG